MNKKFLVLYLLLSASHAQAQHNIYGEDDSSFLPEHFFSYLMVFLAGCFITGLFMFLLQSKKRNRGYNNRSSIRLHAFEKNNHLDFNRTKNTSNSSLDRETRSQPNVELPQSEGDFSRSIFFDNINNVLIKEPDTVSFKETITESSVLYFPNPNIEGNFRKIDGRTNFLEGASIYKFYLLTPTEAEFEFCKEKSSISIALNNRNELILNVAEELNAYNSKASQILSDSKEKGTALLDGTVWKVSKKAKIKYI